MGERIAALAALNEATTTVAQTGVPAPSPAATPVPAQDTAIQQAVANITGSRALQEIAGLRQMAETTSQKMTPNTNAQRADVVGSVLSQRAESTVSAPNATEIRQPVTDVVEGNQGNRLSFNRAILETLRGGFEAARQNVPTVEQQMAAIREALASRRSGEPRAGEEPNVLPGDAGVEVSEGSLEASDASRTRASGAAYPVSSAAGVRTGGGRLNFLV